MTQSKKKTLTQFFIAKKIFFIVYGGNGNKRVKDKKRVDDRDRHENCHHHHIRDIFQRTKRHKNICMGQE